MGHPVEPQGKGNNLKEKGTTRHSESPLTNQFTPSNATNLTPGTSQKKFFFKKRSKLSLSRRSGISENLEQPQKEYIIMQDELVTKLHDVYSHCRIRNHP